MARHLRDQHGPYKQRSANGFTGYRLPCQVSDIVVLYLFEKSSKLTEEKRDKFREIELFILYFTIFFSFLGMSQRN